MKQERKQRWANAAETTRWKPPAIGRVGQPNYKSDTTGTLVISIATFAGNVGGGWYAYKAKGGFWWTLLGILVGGAGGNLLGRLVTLPLRKS